MPADSEISVGTQRQWPVRTRARRSLAGRRPARYVLSLLAAVYGCGVPDLLNYADYEHMNLADLLVISKSAGAAVVLACLIGR